MTPTPSCSRSSARDAAAGLPTWERDDEVRRPGVARGRGRSARAPTAGSPAGWACERVEVPRLEVSSTDLRARVVDGRPLDYLVTAPVQQLIRERGLYAAPE